MVLRFESSFDTATLRTMVEAQLRPGFRDFDSQGGAGDQLIRIRVDETDNLRQYQDLYRIPVSFLTQNQAIFHRRNLSFYRQER